MKNFSNKFNEIYVKNGSKNPTMDFSSLHTFLFGCYRGFLKTLKQLFISKACTLVYYV